MKKRNYIISTMVIVQLLIFSLTFSQNQYKQTIRGNVVDKDAQSPLPGATIVILNTTPIIGTSTDANGDFKLENVPIGRYDLKVSFLGYEPYIIPEVLVGSGKQIVLNIGLKESATTMKEVVIKGDIKKDEPLNSMASISARTFSVEETQRYAGSIDDPARMASAFAGISIGHMENNAIVIRGNSPKGVLWRLEGVEIFNPNHFANMNVAGGGFVTIFSSQMLTNSDFYTSAFPSEYGNALAGVFDMKLRNGNNQKREYAFQIGVLGTDFSAEGPFKKGGQASYLFNYRYSTMALIKPLLPTEQVPNYQDLCLKLNFPTKKAGTFSVWGIGGIDKNKEPDELDSTKWEEDWDRVKYDMTLGMGAAGVSHKLSLGKNAFVQSNIVATGTKSNFDMKRLDDNLQSKPWNYVNSINRKFIFSSYVNNKLTIKHTNRSGIILTNLGYNSELKACLVNLDPSTFTTVVNSKGNSNLVQLYSQSKYDLTEKLTFNVGVHTLYFTLNDKWSLEPRASIRWQFLANDAISFGYGNHSQIESIDIYLTKSVTENGVIQPNKDLGFSKSHHFVLAYDKRLTENLRLKIEPYYQSLYNIPVIKDSSYSFVNYVTEWYFDKQLENTGTGKNFGVDVTIERFLKNNFYFLITGSVFKSSYVGGDGVERNSLYDRRYVVNALIGKEFFIGKNGKNNILGVNGRFIFMGGDRSTPWLLNESVQKKDVVYDYSKLNEKRNPATNMVDLTVTYRINKAKHSSIWALQVKNVLGTKDYYGPYYNYKSNKVIEDYEVIMVPSLSYKIEF